MSLFRKIFNRQPASPLDAEMAELISGQIGKTALRRPVAPGVDGELYCLSDAGFFQVFAGQVEQLCDWFEIQQAIWAGESRRLVIRWVDPQRTPSTFNLAAHEQTAFMRAFDELVARTVVMTMRRKVGSTNILASIRRRADGKLFSTLVADGPLGEAGERVAVELERSLRDAVGLAD